VSQFVRVSGAEAAGIAGGEDLADGPAGVVAHEVDLAEPEAAAESRENLGHRRYGHVGTRGCAAVRGQVDGDAPGRAGTAAR